MTLWKRINRTLDAAMFVLLSVIVVILLAQVFFRYFLGNPLVGSEDAAKLAMMWMVFIGAALATRDRLHVRIDYFVEKMPMRLRKIVDTTLEIAVIAFLGLVVFQSIELFEMNRGMKSVGLDIDVTYFSTALPVGFVLIAVYMIRQLFGKTDD